MNADMSLNSSALLSPLLLELICKSDPYLLKGETDSVYMMVYLQQPWQDTQRYLSP